MQIEKTVKGHLVKFQDNELDLLFKLLNNFIELLVEWSGIDSNPGNLFEELEAEMKPAIGQERSALVSRLFPSAYLDDPEAEKEFRRFTEYNQVRQKIASSQIVLEDLDSAIFKDEVLISDKKFEDWIKTLNQLRLVLAVWLEKTKKSSDLDEDEEENLVMLSDWLGWMIEVLLS